MKSFPSKNGELERMRKGTRVRMADGTLGRVVYADPNLRIARVRTDDRRNVTVRRKTLTQVKP
jgi:preprotein translocase subunit YajC